MAEYFLEEHLKLMFFLWCYRCLWIQIILKRQFPPHSVLIAYFGDYNPSIHHPGYLSDSQFIPDQNDDFLTKVESLHEQHRWEEGWGGLLWEPRLGTVRPCPFVFDVFFLLFMNPLSRCRGFVNLRAVMMAYIFGITGISVKCKIQ